jgi:hypothetical protein
MQLFDLSPDVSEMLADPGGPWPRFSEGSVTPAPGVAPESRRADRLSVLRAAIGRRLIAAGVALAREDQSLGTATGHAIARGS